MKSAQRLDRMGMDPGTPGIVHPSPDGAGGGFVRSDLWIPVRTSEDTWIYLAAGVRAAMALPVCGGIFPVSDGCVLQKAPEKFRTSVD